MKRQRRLILAAMLAWSFAATPALADISARYEHQRENTPIEMVMTLEVDDGGNMRFQVAGQPNYLLVIDDVTYLVSRSASGIDVARFEDLATVMGEVALRLGLGGAFSGELPRDLPAPPKLVAMGEQQINGRSGQAYGMAGDDGKAHYALLVVSKDPKLAPLGAVLVRSFEGSNRMADRMMPGFGAMFGGMNPMLEIMKEGALLSYMGFNLTDVSFDEIADERFKLPGTPLTIDQIREQYRDFAAPPTLPAKN